MHRPLVSSLLGTEPTLAEVEPKVTLVRHTPQPAEAIAAAARLCYAEDTSDLLAQNGKDAGRFVRRLLSMGHLSPIEHASFTFYVEGVSRAMTHQLVRHRLASYSQRSQRYVSHDSFDYVVPPSLAGKTIETDEGEADAAEYYRQAMAEIAHRYAVLNDCLGRLGEASNEDARYVLPNACETKIFVTMNARELLHFFAERLCMRAQWEIRRAAELMLNLSRTACPTVFEGAGPKCVRLGRCPEGSLSCGRYEEMRKLYAAGGAAKPRTAG